MRTHLQERQGRTLRRPQARTHQVRDVAHERSTPRYRCTECRHTAGSMGRSPGIRQRPPSVWQGNHKLPSRLRHDSHYPRKTRRRTQPALPVLTLRRYLQGTRRHRSQPHTHTRGTSGDEEVQPPGRCIHSAGQGHEQRVCKPKLIRCHTGTRR